MFNRKIDLSKNISQTKMSTLEIIKHRLCFKQTVISVKSWAWQPHQKLLQGKAIQTQQLEVPSKLQMQCKKLYIFNLILFGIPSILILSVKSRGVRQVLLKEQNDSPLKTMKNAFYFMEKALFILKIFKFLWFFHFLSKLYRFKRINGNGIIYDILNSINLQT